MDMHLLLIILSVTQAISVYLSIFPSLSHPEGVHVIMFRNLKIDFKKTKQNWRSRVERKNSKNLGFGWTEGGLAIKC